MGAQLEYVASFRDLEVYRRQRELWRRIFRLSQAFPREEQFSLADQLRRAARSVGAQLAESWAKRLYPKHFISKLSDADGEQLEVQHWIIEARDCDYLTPADARLLLDKCEEIGRMLGSMIRKADSFASARYSLRDDSVPYLAPTTLDASPPITDYRILITDY